MAGLRRVLASLSVFFSGVSLAELIGPF